MIAGFLILVNFYLAYRLNRDEGIIVMLQERISEIEGVLQRVSSETK